MGFSCLWFLSRLWKGGLGIVPLRRTLLHFSPYTFKQGIRQRTGTPTDASHRGSDLHLREEANGEATLGGQGTSTAIGIREPATAAEAEGPAAPAEAW